MLIEFVKQNPLFVILFIIYVLAWLITDKLFNKKTPKNTNIYSEKDYKEYLQNEYNEENGLYE